MKKLIQSLKTKYWMWKFNRIVEENNKNVEFIWGIKSYDDVSDSVCNLYTMNDIDIIYDKRNKKYYLGIETIYYFENGIEGERQYIKKLFDKFTEWMKKQNYNVDKQLNIYDVFTKDWNLRSGFDSIEELYTYFKLLVNGFTK